MPANTTIAARNDCCGSNYAAEEALCFSHSIPALAPKDSFGARESDVGALKSDLMIGFWVRPILARGLPAARAMGHNRLPQRHSLRWGLQASDDTPVPTAASDRSVASWRN